VVRSKAQIEATVDNAQALIELAAEHGSFRRYLKSHPSFDDTVADLKRQVRFIGDTSGYHFLWSVNEPTPDYEEWSSKRGSRAPGGGALGA
jgi:3-methyladenine DNA glycosylase Tag